MSTAGSTPEQRWQGVIDRAFPGGVMGFQQPSTGEAGCPMLWLRVMRMEGIHPVLNMYCGTFVLPGRVLTGWDVEDDGVSDGITRVRATFAPPAQDYVYVTPPEPLASQLARARTSLEAEWRQVERDNAE